MALERYSWPALAEEVAAVYEAARGPSRPVLRVHTVRPVRPNRCYLSRSASGPPPAHREHPMHRTPRPTKPVGLYDPATSTTPAASPWSPGSTATRRHETVQRACSRSRTSSTAAPRAPTRTPATAPGSCSRSPTRSSAASSTELPPPGRYGVGVCFLPHDDERRAELEALLTSHRRGRGPARPRLARRAGRPGPRRRHRQRRRALHQAALRGRRDAGLPEDQDAFERKLYVIRRVVELRRRARTS